MTQVLAVELETRAGRFAVWAAGCPLGAACAAAGMRQACVRGDAATMTVRSLCGLAVRLDGGAGTVVCGADAVSVTR